MALPAPWMRRSTSTAATDCRTSRPMPVAAVISGPAMSSGLRPRRSMKPPAQGRTATAATEVDDTTSPATALEVPSSPVRYSGRAG